MAAPTRTSTVPISLVACRAQGIGRPRSARASPSFQLAQWSRWSFRRKTEQSERAAHSKWAPLAKTSTITTLQRPSPGSLPTRRRRRSRQPVLPPESMREPWISRPPRPTASLRQPRYPSPRQVARGRSALRSILPVRRQSVTWSTSNTDIATVDNLGYVTGVAPGPVTIKATAPNGVFGTTSFTVIAGDAPTAAIYRNHLEFGTPTDNTPDDEHLLVHRQFVESYNKNRGGPNWVSWDLNSSQFGPAPRCDCFSADQTHRAPRRIRRMLQRSC
jgi:hypothetical protein